MQLGLATDHAGFPLKEAIALLLHELGHDVKDFGATVYDPDDDYPDFVIPLAQAVAQGEVARGVALCGSGIGACIAANKVAGVRAAICHDTYGARQGVEHDDMNLIVFGARIIGPELAYDVLRAFLSAKPNPEPRHLRRLKKLEALETGGAPPPSPS